MNLIKPQKILIGVLTAWVVFYPLLFILVIFGTVFSTLWTVQSFNGEPTPVAMIPFFAIFPLHCLTIFLQLGLSAFYLAHIIKNHTGSETVQIILGIGVFMFPFIAMPVYYYLYIWRDDPPNWAKQQQGG